MGSAGGYAGYAYFDTFPEAEDPTREAAYNVRAFKRMWRWRLGWKMMVFATYFSTTTP